MAAGLAAYGLWRKLTPAQRRLLLDAARDARAQGAPPRHARTAPKVAAAAAAVATARRKR